MGIEDTAALARSDGRYWRLHTISQIMHGKSISDRQTHHHMSLLNRQVRLLQIALDEPWYCVRQTFRKSRLAYFGQEECNHPNVISDINASMQARKRAGKLIQGLHALRLDTKYIPLTPNAWSRMQGMKTTTRSASEIHLLAAIPDVCKATHLQFSGGSEQDQLR
jgi:hypothetical protein